MQGLGPRFALEVAFLIALAIGAGVAELSAGAIVAVMAVAWLLICLFELAVWAGVIPLGIEPGAPVPDAGVDGPPPAYAAEYERLT